MKATAGLAGVAAVLVLGLAGPTAAQNEEVEKARWQELYRALWEAVDEAEAKIAATQEKYRDGRQKRRLRGEEKALLLEEMKAARAERTKAREELERFPEDARRAGVPPGWLREVDLEREEARAAATTDAVPPDPAPDADDPLAAPQP
ncbi:MAG: hypothetical protein MJE66_02600 [Proteobacteria bacterium]|nr:hypothetical protein [Pseudomonadota bacterium]